MKSTFPTQSVRNDIQSGYIGAGSPMWEYAPELSGHLNRCTTELNKARAELEEMDLAISNILESFKVPFASMLPEGAQSAYRKWDQKRIEAQSRVDLAYKRASEARAAMTIVAEVTAAMNSTERIS